jgi:hypothetical protein
VLIDPEDGFTLTRTDLGADSVEITAENGSEIIPHPAR